MNYASSWSNILKGKKTHRTVTSLRGVFNLSERRAATVLHSGSSSRVHAVLQFVSCALTCQFTTESVKSTQHVLPEKSKIPLYWSAMSHQVTVTSPWDAG